MSTVRARDRQQTPIEYWVTAQKLLNEVTKILLSDKINDNVKIILGDTILNVTLKIVDNAELLYSLDDKTLVQTESKDAQYKTARKIRVLISCLHDRLLTLIKVTTSKTAERLTGVIDNLVLLRNQLDEKYQLKIDN